MSGFSFKTTYIVYAAPLQVFEAITDPGIVAAWGGGMSVIEPQLGGVFEMFDGWVKGEITAYQPGKELGFTWKPGEWDKKIKASNVHISFREHPAGTELFLEHTNFPDQEESIKHGNGWIDYVFDPVNDYFTGGFKETEDSEEGKED